MLANESETLELMKWLSKAVITVTWFSGGVETGIIVAEHINEFNCMKRKSYYMCYKTPENG